MRLTTESRSKNYISVRVVTFYLLAALLASLLSACAPASAAATASSDNSATPMRSATQAPLSTNPAPTVEMTPPDLPATYQSSYLNPYDTPHSYIQDECQYLRNRWNPLSAQPGTVVMIILIHNVYNGPVEESGGINATDLERMMEQLHGQGFVAINTARFLAFMERNIRIPPRSALIIQDDRHKADNFDVHFRDYWNAWGWPIVNGWASQPDTSESLWDDNIRLEQEGWVDHQAQGVMIGTLLTDDTSKAIINRELQGSIDAFADKFGKTPLAFIWPGGSFGARPVMAARQLGYQLGFTSNSRGPVMYNWVPQASTIDPARPSYQPEVDIGDPLMTLPRYWPYQVIDALDQVRIMGKEATAYALANKDTEIKYYNIVCAATHGPLPSP